MSTLRARARWIGAMCVATSSNPSTMMKPSSLNALTCAALSGLLLVVLVPVVAAAAAVATLAGVALGNVLHGGPAPLSGRGQASCDARECSRRCEVQVAVTLRPPAAGILARLWRCTTRSWRDSSFVMTDTPCHCHNFAPSKLELRLAAAQLLHGYGCTIASCCPASPDCHGHPSASGASCTWAEARWRSILLICIAMHAVPWHCGSAFIQEPECAPAATAMWFS